MSDTVSLDSALDSHRTLGRPVKAFLGNNTGNRTFTINLSLSEVNEMTEVANDQSLNTDEVAQRRLDISHSAAIGKYILKGLLAAVLDDPKIEPSDALDTITKSIGLQPYMAIPPLVASWRNAGARGTNLKVVPLKVMGTEETVCYRIFLSQADILWIIDGQHRRKAVELVNDFIRFVLLNHKYPARGPVLLYDGGKYTLESEELRVWHHCLEKMKVCTVTVEVHLGLTVEQERQLFHDLNNLGKRVEKGNALQFDGSNPVNTYIKDRLFEKIFREAGIPEITEQKRKEGAESGFTHQELVSINALLFLNKTNIQGATPAQVDAKMALANEFWSHVATIPGLTEEDARKITVAAQPVVIKALAKLTYDFHSEKKRRWNTPENQTKLWRAFTEFDFSNENPAWGYYTMDEDEIKANGLEGLRDYLPTAVDGNRDLGILNNGIFHFGAKHNDIYPLIGDIIRWKADLPTRLN